MQYRDNDYMIVYNLKDDGVGSISSVKVGPWPDTTRWSENYTASTGCDNNSYRKLSEVEQAQVLLNLAADLMFQGADPSDVLREFGKIRIWCEMGINLPEGRFERALASDDVTKWAPS